MNLVVTPSGLTWNARTCRVALGRGGIDFKQHEGDGITPLGTFPFRRVLHRADRVTPQTRLPRAPLTPRDGWCDAPADPAYNTQIRLPYPASHEALWRADALYDLIVVLGFNDAPVVPGKGSAIFLHVARDDYGPTEGCVALAKDDLIEILAALAPGDTLTIKR
jgi:L,D-peptidoglycan transpeptidase YkuD (ErfK/YbiS/YcfS/YnhG family)